MKILRVAIFPSIEKRTVGLHPAKLCKINSVKTIYLTSKDNVTRPKVEGDYKLFEFAKPLENRVAEQAGSDSEAGASSNEVETQSPR